MKYRVVELILIWMIYPAAFGRNKTPPIHRYNTYKYNITHIYWRSTHRHYNVNRSYTNIHSNTRLELFYLFTVLSARTRQEYFINGCLGNFINGCLGSFFLRATSGERNFIERIKAPIFLEAVLATEKM